MLLDPSSAAPAAPDANSMARASKERRRSRKPPVTRAEAARADARTCTILEAHRIDFRPAQETVLVALSTGAMYPLSETRDRPLFAAQLRRRAAAMCLTFDAYRQRHDLGDLRLVGLRPRQGKARPGTLAQALAAFARDYDRHVGRLVTAGTISPVLSAVHIRYDATLGLWDIHLHALWDVADDKVDAMWMGLGVKFADKWMDGDKVERPGAAVNYCVSRVIDHREIMTWPEEAILELWNLPRVRLMRPAGAFRVYRGTLEDKTVWREGNRVMVEERPDPGPRRKAAKRPGPAVEAGRVVAIGKKSIAGEETLCAVVKRPRAPKRAEGIGAGAPVPSRAGVDLAYGEYRRNSPSADPAPPRTTSAPGLVAPSAPLASPPRKAAKGALRALPPRKAWMLAAWPPGPLGRLPRPIARKLARQATGTLRVASPSRPVGVVPPAPEPFSGRLGVDTVSGHQAGQPAPVGRPYAVGTASRARSASTATASLAVIGHQTLPAGSTNRPTRSPRYASSTAGSVPYSVAPAARNPAMVASTSSPLRSKQAVVVSAASGRQERSRRGAPASTGSLAPP